VKNRKPWEGFCQIAEQMDWQCLLIRKKARSSKGCLFIRKTFLFFNLPECLGKIALNVNVKNARA
jgi:hypothetical protein